MMPKKKKKEEFENIFINLELSTAPRVST